MESKIPSAVPFFGSSPSKPTPDTNHSAQSIDTTPSASTPIPSAPYNRAPFPLIAQPPLDLTFVPPSDQCDNPPCQQAAIIVCGICNEAPYLSTDPPIAQYCGTPCQKADLLRHVKRCDFMQDRLTLFRVMDVALRQLYVYRELSWHAFDVEGLEIVVGEKAGVECAVVRGVRVKDACWPNDYRPFPTQMAKSKEDREALLVFLAKFDAVTWASEWIHGLLGDIVIEITKIVHEVKQAPRKMLFEDLRIISPPEITKEEVATDSNDKMNEELKLSWEEMNCEVLKVKLKSGEEYIIDLAAAQYGYFDKPVVEWRDYERTRTITSTTSQPPNPNQTLNPLDYRLSVRLRAYYNLAADESKQDLLIRHLKSLNIHLMEWQFDGGMSLKKLWEAPEGDFREKKDNLCDFLEYKLNRFAKANFTIRGRELARVVRLRGKWEFGGKRI